MLLSNGPLSPEHIYQEIVGYGKARKRGRCLLWVKITFFLDVIKIMFAKNMENWIGYGEDI